MNDNTIYNLQPATKQQSRKLFRFYPTEANTTEKIVIDSDSTQGESWRLINCSCSTENGYPGYIVCKDGELLIEQAV